MKNKLKSFFADKRGNIVMWQRPNLPVILWAVFLLVSKLTSGAIQSVASYLSLAALIFWALLEILWGASPFRRTLGAVILLMSIINRLM